MKSIKEVFNSADWKLEKHVPVIEINGQPRKSENIKFSISVGKEIVHPNTTEHHIAYIEAYFLPRGEKNPTLISRVEFSSHGASTKGPNTGGVYTIPIVKLSFKTDNPGTILVYSYCNIHGLWDAFYELNF
ncbi:MAG: desulfoferrodoxin family protein [Candidatus Gygaella obscura]|nr:desulfoferrodoxin family protein [Candidatus Gygaella obscura]